MPASLPDNQRAAIWNAKGYHLINVFDRIPNSRLGRFNYGGAWSVNGSVGLSENLLYIQAIPLNGTYSEGYCGFALFKGVNSLDHIPYISFFNGAEAHSQITVAFKDFGVIEVLRGNANTGTLLSRTISGTYQDNRWFYVEIHAEIANVGGNVQVRVNTEIVLDIVSVDTQALAVSSFDSLVIGFRGLRIIPTIDQAVDDLYFCDTAGSINNSFLGNCRVKTQFASVNSTPLQFTIGGTSPAPTNWQSVNNRGLTEAQLVFSGVTGHLDMYELQAIVDSPTVFGVQVSSAMRQSDATQRFARNVIRASSTQVEGVTHALNQDFTYYRDIWEINPHTGIGFTDAEVNALRAGFKVQG